MSDRCSKCSFEPMVIEGRLWNIPPRETNGQTLAGPQAPADEFVQRPEAAPPETGSPLSVVARVAGGSIPSDAVLYISIDSSGSMKLSVLSILIQIMELERVLLSRGTANITVILTTFEDGRTKDALPPTLLNDEGRAMLLDAVMRIEFGAGAGEETADAALRDGCRRLNEITGSGKTQKFLLVLTDSEDAATVKDNFEEMAANDRGFNPVVVRDLHARMGVDENGREFLWREKIGALTRLFASYIKSKGEDGRRQVEAWAAESRAFLFRLAALNALKPGHRLTELIGMILRDPAWKKIEEAMYGERFNLMPPKIAEHRDAGGRQCRYKLDYYSSYYFLNCDNVYGYGVTLPEDGFTMADFSRWSYMPILSELGEIDAQRMFLKKIVEHKGGYKADLYRNVLAASRIGFDAILETITSDDFFGSEAANENIALFMKHLFSFSLTPERVDCVVRRIAGLIDTNIFLARAMFRRFAEIDKRIRSSNILREKFIAAVGDPEKNYLDKLWALELILDKDEPLFTEEERRRTAEGSFNSTDVAGELAIDTSIEFGWVTRLFYMMLLDYFVETGTIGDAGLMAIFDKLVEKKAREAVMNIFASDEQALANMGAESRLRIVKDSILKLGIPFGAMLQRIGRDEQERIARALIADDDLGHDIKYYLQLKLMALTGRYNQLYREAAAMQKRTDEITARIVETGVKSGQREAGFGQSLGSFLGLDGGSERDKEQYEILISERRTLVDVMYEVDKDLQFGSDGGDGGDGDARANAYIAAFRAGGKVAGYALAAIFGKHDRQRLYHYGGGLAKSLKGVAAAIIDDPGSNSSSLPEFLREFKTVATKEFINTVRKKIFLPELPPVRKKQLLRAIIGEGKNYDITFDRRILDTLLSVARDPALPEDLRRMALFRLPNFGTGQNEPAVKDELRSLSARPSDPLSENAAAVLRRMEAGKPREEPDSWKEERERRRIEDSKL